MDRRITGLIVLMAMSIMAMSNSVFAQAKGFDPFSRTGATRTNLSTNVISNVEFTDEPITSIFRMISDLTGSSIIMSPDVSKQPPRINLWVKNLTPEEVLDKVVEMAGLVADRKGSAVSVLTFDEYTRLHGVEKRVIRLEHANASEVAKLLQPYVDKQAQARIAPFDNGRAVVLLVPAPLSDSLVRLVRSVDIPDSYNTDTIRILTIKYADATKFGPRLETFFSQSSGPGGRRQASAGANEKSSSASGPQPAGAGEPYTLRFLIEPSLNVIVLRGLASDVAEAATLVEKLDVPQDIKVVGYPLQYTAAQDVFDTLNGILASDDRSGGNRESLPQRMRVALSQQNNQIIVEGSPADHKRVAGIIKAIDKALAPGNGGIRVYRLENSTADEVAAVIQALIEAREEESSAAERGAQANMSTNTVSATASIPTPNGRSSPASYADSPTPEALDPGDLERPSIVAASEINALVIRASAAEHEEFAAVVAELDKPRDQVILEMTLVTVASKDAFDLGLEMAGAATINNDRVNMVSLTSFGVGSAHASGSVSVASPPPFGLNYALFNSDDFSLVFNALQTVGDTKVVSSPKILVEDNAQTLIRRTRQEPYDVTTIADGGTTTAFGGFVDAGTILAFTPQISEKDWLRLSYEVTLSSFGARMSLASPPPVLENSLAGIVRVPADHMVVLGGLVGQDNSTLVDKVPFLGDIPILGELFKRRSSDGLNETLFVFVRPTILRDERFRDLINLSRADIETANVAFKDWPKNPLMQYPASKEEAKSR